MIGNVEHELRVAELLKDEFRSRISESLKKTKIY